MPAGDPAGYLPNVVRARRRRGEAPYQPRRNRGGGKFRPSPGQQVNGEGGMKKPLRGFREKVLPAGSKVRSKPINPSRYKPRGTNRRYF